MADENGEKRLQRARAEVKAAYEALAGSEQQTEGTDEHLTAALDTALEYFGVVETAQDQVLSERVLANGNELVRPEPLELGRLDGLRQTLHHYDLKETDEAGLTDHVGDLNTLLDVSVNALGATTVDALLQRVVEGARLVTGARRAAAGYGVRAGSFCFSTTSPSDEQESATVAEELLAITPDLLAGRHSFRLSRDERPGLKGGLIAARLVGKEGAADGYLVAVDKAEGESDFTAKDEALLGQLAAFTSLGLQHIQARAEAIALFAEAEEERSVLRAIMEYVPEGITVADGPDATIRTVSRFGSQMFGRAPAELLGASVQEQIKLWQLCHVAGGRPATAEELPLTRAIRNGETITDEEWMYESSTKDKAYALFNAGPIRDREGHVTGGIAVWRDITKRKLAEAELLDAKERLLRQEKLAYLGALAGGVGHELRTPLGSIRNAAYFLKMVIREEDEDISEALSILEKEVSSAESIITALLDFARPTAPERIPTDLKELLRQTLSTLEIPETVEMQLDLESEITISVDPGQISQVFFNIILNAIQAMPNGGRLTVVSKSDEGSKATIMISDTGLGLSTKAKDELFEPLYTTKARGIGLGLTVAQTLVRRHGGRIEVESEPGSGATFKVVFPRQEGSHEVPHAGE